MTVKLEPTEAQLKALISRPAEQPLAVLNLFQFNSVAEYQPGDPEFGTDAANISGEEAYRRYGAEAAEFIEALGGRMEMSADVEQILIGSSEHDWHKAAILFFPSRAAFLSMMANPDFQAASRHRKAALANHIMIHLDGSGFLK